MAVKSLTWRDVNEWRLSQHYLNELRRRDFVEVVSRICGVQAQLMSAAELALWTRVKGLTHEDIQNALWQERRLIKTWAMRGTLHLLAADELPLYAAARNFYDNRNWIGYFDYYGFTPAQYEAFLAAVPEVLGGEPMTRDALATALANSTGIPKFRELILESSWGSPLKPSAFRGDLCFGPSQGQNVTFVNPRKWIKGWETIEPEEALKEIIRRYLRAYGPSTPTDFTRWWWGGAGLSIAKKVFRSMQDELESVEVEGWPAVALRETLGSMQRLESSNAIALLPLFDAYTLGIGRDIEPLLPKVYKSRVYRPQGWISAVVLIDGLIKGVWEYKTQRGQTLVKVDLFVPAWAKLTAIKRGIEKDVKRLGEFWNTDVVLEFEGEH